MSYIEEFETEFRKRIESSPDSDSLVQWVSEKVLESYRNGLTAGKKGEKVGRQGASRRRGSFGKAQ